MRPLVVAALLNLLLAGPAIAQSNPSAPPDRLRALTLFGEGKRLEALPILENLAGRNPEDTEVLVALAASLVDHAATLTDPDAAARERFRARDIVQKAWSLGHSSPLAENLRQLLGQLPASGALEYSRNPVVDEIMRAGEAAFARREFDAALSAYAKALSLEPGNYPATLFSANTYDRKDDFAKAAEWYERAIRLEPDLETAYRYYADMLARQGDMSGARRLLIQAVVAEPYNKIVWREIRAWAVINKTAFNLVYVPVPAQVEAAKAGESRQSEALSSAWRAYENVKAEWQGGGRFQKQFPQESAYRHSLPEESEALTAAANVLVSLKHDERAGAAMAADAGASLLLKLQEAGYIDAYTLFSLGDDGIAKDYIAYRTNSRAKLEGYIDQFVLPPAPR